MQLAVIISILLELRSRLRSPGIDAGYLSVNCCRNISTVNFLPKNCCQNRKMPKIARLLNDSKTWRSPKTIGRRPLCFSEEPRLRETQEKAHKFKTHEGEDHTSFCLSQQNVDTRLQLRTKLVQSTTKLLLTGVEKKEKQRLSKLVSRKRLSSGNDLGCRSAQYEIDAQWS